MMSSKPSKLNKSELDEEPKDALEFVRYVRETLNKQLVVDEKKQANYDFEHIVREIRAIIAVNDEIHEEIFSRCMVDVQLPTSDRIIMKSFDFTTIECRRVGTKFDIVFLVECTDETFNAWALTNLPPGMGDMVTVNYKPSTFKYSNFVDFDDYFRKVLMLLRDDALELLLPKLKDHLEAVQVCLGQIHECAMQPMTLSSSIGFDLMEVLKIPTKIKLDGCCFCGRNYYDSFRFTALCTGEVCGDLITVLRSVDKIYCVECRNRNARAFDPSGDCSGSCA